MMGFIRWVMAECIRWIMTRANHVGHNEGLSGGSLKVYNMWPWQGCTM
jgi:hypothetical protein